ncbi:substrate-binding domain-containing protein [Oceanobacillus jeddahense]|uniref:substrate-binding domain-containing protein n=1 Tax=Oceanobacillus jeddahense TaxID=1462527 RepID=UPI0005960C89|nr:substrate-binding domain-containing protein [Oceanobacillus jeddahense]
MKKAALLFMFLISGFILAACGSNGAEGQNNEGGDEGSEDITIGYAINTLNNPFFVEVKESAEAAAEELGVNISVVNANGDLSEQISGVEDLVQQQVDVLIVDPVDSEGSLTAINGAVEAGIPVITTGRSIEGADVVTHMGYDEVKNGEIAGEFLAEQLEGQGKVIELQGTLGTDVANNRSEGFNNALSNYPDIEIVSSQSADFDRTEGMNVTENILQSHSEIDGLYAANDEMGLGALQALNSNNLSDVAVVSNDGTGEALNSVKDEELTGTMAVSPKAYGEEAVVVAIDVVNGEEQPEYIELPSEFVSLENVEEFLAEQ